MNWEWKINIPYRDRSDPIGELGLAARHLDDEQDVAVVQALAMEAILAGHETVGDLLDELEQLDQPGRRAVLDKAREGAGLEPTDVIEQRRTDAKFESRWSDLQPPPPEPWDELQRCHAPGCKVFPAQNGQIIPVEVERWFCPEHEALAQPGDLEKHIPPVIGLGLNYQPVLSEREKARLEAWHRKRQESEQRERELREAHLLREAEALDAVKERYAETARVSVAGVQVAPKNLNVHEGTNR